MRPIQEERVETGEYEASGVSEQHSEGITVLVLVEKETEVENKHLELLNGVSEASSSLKTDQSSSEEAREGQTVPSSPACRILRSLLLATILLGCFISLLLMYIKPSPSWSSGLIDSEAFNRSDPNQTTVLLWLWPFGKAYELNVCASLFGIDGCFITADRNLYNRADAVVIHHGDISSDLSNMPPPWRPTTQKWIWMNLESPTHSRRLAGIQNLFNLTLNYRQDADIKMPYGSIVPAQSEEDFVPPSKNKLVCWIVSNWNRNHERAKYYNELNKHIEIHTYGRAFSKYVSHQDFLPTIASCKFYLALENSIHKDYITEKFYNPLSVGTVPVVLGPPRENYQNFLQGDAFIHVDDFSSPKELAERLLSLDKDEELYLKYFHWRKHSKVKKAHFWAEHTCLACDYVRRHNESKAVNNLDKWFWG